MYRAYRKKCIYLLVFIQDYVNAITCTWDQHITFPFYNAVAITIKHLPGYFGSINQKIHCRLSIICHRGFVKSSAINLGVHQSNPGYYCGGICLRKQTKLGCFSDDIYTRFMNFIQDLLLGIEFSMGQIVGRLLSLISFEKVLCNCSQVVIMDLRALLHVILHQVSLNQKCCSI